MKINPTTAYQKYNKVSEYNHVPRSMELRAEATVQQGGNMDQIQISPEGARKMEISQLTRTIMSELEHPASSERLRDLRAQVQSGTYHVPTKELAGAVMEHLFMA